MMSIWNVLSSVLPINIHCMLVPLWLCFKMAAYMWDFEDIKAKLALISTFIINSHVLFILGFRDAPGGAQVLCPTLFSEIIPGETWGPYEVLEIEPESAQYKASSLSTISSLQHPNSSTFPFSKKEPNFVSPVFLHLV